MNEPFAGIRGILFDLDGVLVFTDRLHFAAWKLLADRLGISFTEEDNHALRGVSRAESLERLLAKLPGKVFTSGEREALAEEKNAVYRASLASLSPSDIPPEVRAALAELRRRGYRLAVASSSRNAEEILSRVELTEAFDVLVSGHDISASKPDPEVFLLAAARLGVPPTACAVVEDAEAGLMAARAAAMLPIAVPPASARITVQSIPDLVHLLR